MAPVVSLTLDSNLGSGDPYSSTCSDQDSSVSRHVSVSKSVNLFVIICITCTNSGSEWLGYRRNVLALWMCCACLAALLDSSNIVCFPVLDVVTGVAHSDLYGATMRVCDVRYRLVVVSRRWRSRWSRYSLEDNAPRAAIWQGAFENGPIPVVQCCCNLALLTARTISTAGGIASGIASGSGHRWQQCKLRCGQLWTFH